MTRPDYVRKYWHVALETGLRFGINPVAILAHALKESGVNNANAVRRNNFFGFLKSASPRRFHEYPTVAAGYEAYARRMVTAYPAAVRASGNSADFARTIAYHKNPTYVHESAAQKAQYAQTLASIYRGVAADVARLKLPTGLVADQEPLTPRPVSLTSRSTV